MNTPNENAYFRVPTDAAATIASHPSSTVEHLAAYLVLRAGVMNHVPDRSTVGAKAIGHSLGISRRKAQNILAARRESPSHKVLHGAMIGADRF